MFKVCGYVIIALIGFRTDLSPRMLSDPHVNWPEFEYSIQKFTIEQCRSFGIDRFWKLF